MNNSGIDLWNKAKKLIPGGNQLLSKRSEMFLPDGWPSYYKKAKGCEIWDLDDNHYYDMSIMGIGSCVLGYADPEVNKAVKKAVDLGNMSTFNCYEEVELAEKLVQLHPWAQMVRFARTGGEACAIAVRIARAHAKKDKVAFCYDDKTEILTKSGFKKFKDLNENEAVATLNPDTNQLEYKQIERKIKYHFAGKMIHFKGQRVDLMVTPEHKIYRKFRLKKGYHFKLIEARAALKAKTMIQMTSVCKWEGEASEKISIPNLIGQTRPTKGIYSFSMKDFVKFMGWYLSEGSYTEQKRGRYEVVITQDRKNSAKSREIFSTIKKLGFISYRNSHHICFNSKELVQYLKQFGKCKNKYIPDWIKNLSVDYLSVFVEAMVKGDGTFEKGRMRKFYSASCKLIEGMQEILLKLGYSTTVSEYRNTGFSQHKIYHLNIGKEKVLGSWPKEECYEGDVYCVTVPNHIILVRRNGKIVWSGNCGYHGWHDWYLCANLSDSANLDGQLLPGLAPAGVPRALKGHACPFNYGNIEELRKIINDTQGELGVIIMEVERHKKIDVNFLAQVRAIANEIGAVLIFDEVSSGFRLNIGSIHTLYGLEPDIVVLGKAMGNGYPISAVVGKSGVMQAAQDTFISSTYWTERIGPVAALKTIEQFEKKNVVKHIVDTGNYLSQKLTNIFSSFCLNIELVGMASVPTLLIKENEPLVVKTIFTQEMLRRGFLASNIIYVSYAHTREIVDKYLAAAEEVIGLIAKGIKSGDLKSLLKGEVCHSGFKRLI